MLAFNWSSTQGYFEASPYSTSCRKQLSHRRKTSHQHSRPIARVDETLRSSTLASADNCAIHSEKDLTNYRLNFDTFTNDLQLFSSMLYFFEIRCDMASATLLFVTVAGRV